MKNTTISSNFGDNLEVFAQSWFNISTFTIIPRALEHSWQRRIPLSTITVNRGSRTDYYTKYLDLLKFKLINVYIFRTWAPTSNVFVFTLEMKCLPICYNAIQEINCIASSIYSIQHRSSFAQNWRHRSLFITRAPTEPADRAVRSKSWKVRR